MGVKNPDDVPTTSFCVAALFSAMSGRDAPRQTEPGSSGFTSLTFDDAGRLHFKVNKLASD